MNRILKLKGEVQNFKPEICTERALLWTEYHRKRKNRKKPSSIKIAEALKKVLLEKTIKIYPHELIVGNFTSKRVGGSILPELHGLAIMMDIFKFSKRETNPLEVSGKEIIELLKIVPFWLFRSVGVKAFRSPLKAIGFVLNQLRSHFYLINETGGISHIAPDYEKLINIGTDGIISEAEEFQGKALKGSSEWYFYEAVKIIAEGLAEFGKRYSDIANQMAISEKDPLEKKSSSILQEHAGIYLERGQGLLMKHCNPSFLLNCDKSRKP